MGRPSDSIVLLPPATTTTTRTGSEVIGIEQYTSAIIKAQLQTTTGTSPTFDIYIQQGFRPGTGSTVVGEKAEGALVWDDYAAFTQLTSTATSHYLRIVGSGNVASVASAAALAAASVRNGPLGSYWRAVVKVGGTSPSANITVVAQLIP